MLGKIKAKMTTTPKAWYLVYTKPRAEDQAANHLRRQGYDVYLPKMMRERRLRSRYQRVIECLFPRYLFIHLDNHHDNWAPIRFTLGVSQMVTFGDTPAQVPNELIEMLQHQEDQQGLYILPRPAVDVGSKVRVIDGVMQGYEGIFTARNSQERVTILIECAQRSRRVEMHIHQIVPLRA